MMCGARVQNCELCPDCVTGTESSWLSMYGVELTSSISALLKEKKLKSEQELLFTCHRNTNDPEVFVGNIASSTDKRQVIYPMMKHRRLQTALSSVVGKGVACLTGDEPSPCFQFHHDSLSQYQVTGD